MTAKENGGAGDAPAVGELANSSSYTEQNTNHSMAQDQFDRTPMELRAYRSWVVWRFEHANNQAKLTKVPYNPLTSKHASSTDPNTWCDFNTCVDAVRAQVGWHGIGFVLSPHDPYCFVDLDQTKDKDGTLLHLPDVTARQTEIYKAANSYSELSPSERGLHIIVRGHVEKGRKRDFVEIYSQDRFMTMTGNVYPLGAQAAAILPAQDLCDHIWHSLANANAADEANVDMSVPAQEDDAAVLLKASTARNGAKFSRVLNGDASDYRNDDSRADMAFCRMLAFYTQSAEQIDGIWLASPLGQRHKAQSRRKYRQDTIRKALASAAAERAAEKAHAEAAGAQFEEAMSNYLPTPQSPSAGTVGPTFSPLVAQPFAWRDPASIPPRDWVYGRVMLRGAVTATIGHGGSGKSALTVVETLAMVSGIGLLGVQPARLEGCRVWVINLEEPKDELDRRFSAAALHYKLTPQHCGDRLFVNGSETDLCIAEDMRNGTTICAPVVEAVKENIRRNGIDVVIVDPFVSSHRVSENDNGAIDLVVKQWGKIAAELGVAIHLVHHSRKTNGGPVTDEDGRGAVSLKAGVRKMRTLNPMSETQAKDADIDGEDRFDYFFIKQDGKSNMSKRSGALEWYKFESRMLPNGPNGWGDDVGVVTRWHWPNNSVELSAEQLEAVRSALADGQAREAVQAAQYVGKVVALALSVELTVAKALIAQWLKSGALITVMAPDKNREQRPFVRIGDWSKAVAALE